MLTNKGLKSLKYQTKFQRAVDQESFESMTLDMNNSVPESNPFSSHSTVRTPGSYPLYFCFDDHSHISDQGQGLTAGDIGRKLNKICDILQSIATDISNYNKEIQTDHLNKLKGDA